MPISLTPDTSEQDLVEQDQRPTVLVPLKPVYFEYLRARAENAGEDIGEHAARIIREFHAYHDRKRPDHRPRAAEPGTGPVVRRA